MRGSIYFAKKSLQIIADFLMCRNIEFLKDLKLLKKELTQILKINKITQLRETSYIFNPSKGFTYLIILKESHLAFHTWPEKKLVNIDIFICNFKKQNQKKVINLMKSLEKLFLPQKKIVKKIERLT